LKIVEPAFFLVAVQEELVVAYGAIVLEGS
jgi:hypothetical protein